MRIRPTSDTLGSPLALLNAASRKHSVELGSTTAAQKGATHQQAAGSSPALPSVNYLSKAAVTFNQLNPANPNLKHTRETILERSLKQQQQQQQQGQSPEGRQLPRNRPQYRENALLKKQSSEPIRGVTPGSNLIASAVFMTSRMVGQDGHMFDDDGYGGSGGGGGGDDDDREPGAAAGRRAPKLGLGIGVERFPVGSFERGFETGFDDGDVHSEASPTPLSPTPLGSGRCFP